LLIIAQIYANGNQELQIPDDLETAETHYGRKLHKKNNQHQPVAVYKGNIREFNKKRSFVVVLLITIFLSLQIMELDWFTVVVVPVYVQKGGGGEWKNKHHG
jgi:hypothetical protein